MKSFEVVNALVTLTFVLTGEDRGWENKGAEGVREAGEERVGSVSSRGRGGENMGKLCNNTQYFVIEKRAGGRKPRKKVGCEITY